MKTIDACIGLNIRNRRHILGMSQTDLANKIGVTFQQVQKYEKGHNKIMASRLLEISNIMNVEINYFFEGCTAKQVSESQTNTENFVLNEEAAIFSYNTTEKDLSTENMKLVKIYNKISNPDTKKKLMLFLKSIYDNQE